MSLKDILQKLVSEKTQVLLADSQSEWQAEVLLENLSETRLKTSAHMQPGLYIAEINEAGYLGRVLYKLKNVASEAQ
ncbi:MAG: hypothetical protein E4H23_04430 [Chrysiogenales bacterium]|nr:hypothetical protein [Candidatus Aminicenantes bacterium]TFG79883.1 MAG: hypothetical protein E4H23_04430 [Chrysiogenales bacterium]